MEETGTLVLSALSSMDKTVSISNSLRAAFAFSGLKQYPPKINRESHNDMSTKNGCHQQVHFPLSLTTAV